MPATTYTRNDHGRCAPVRTIERLPNGKWRIDYASGLVELRDTAPTTHTRA